VDCQADGYVDCYAEVSGGCEAECMSPDGALFCDGQYVDHGGNLDACRNALRDAFDIEVMSSGSAMCADGSCTAEGEVSVGCAAAPGQTAGSRWAGLVGFLAVGLLFVRRRRS
jgi:MYXO-CTERM domain-containing protein